MKDGTRAFESEFEANYGFDPERARQLLAEAGYEPGDIEINFPTMNFSGNPELSQIAEAIQLDLDAVGNHHQPPGDGIHRPPSRPGRQAGLEQDVDEPQPAPYGQPRRRSASSTPTRA